MYPTADWKLDDELRLFLINELMMIPSFVNAIEPVIRIVTNVEDLYDVGKMNFLELMHCWWMTNLPAIGHDKSWILAYSEDLHCMFALSEYIVNRFCPLDANNVRHEPMMETLKAFMIRDFDFYFARSAAKGTKLNYFVTVTITSHQIFTFLETCYIERTNSNVTARNVSKSRFYLISCAPPKYFLQQKGSQIECFLPRLDGESTINCITG